MELLGINHTMEIKAHLPITNHKDLEVTLNHKDSEVLLNHSILEGVTLETIIINPNHLMVVATHTLN